ncbi:MAG: hypothetical protein H0Z28_10135 [Archaeoglobus sp.]|nr:hypothetical protein [Archaeoglobus sp.]
MPEPKGVKLTKKEVISRFNKLIEEGKIFDGVTVTGAKLSELMEAYRVDKVGRSAKYNYTCDICGKNVGEDDFFVFCRLKGTSHRWKTARPVHKKCLEEVDSDGMF